ncbi:unnamed protein product [Calicophoron daubneyi]|uniref:Uncharacterized protein n=1 Tax=Calicophoron daubneyi TaxID=300641 RepID=A0AAV2TEQ6_CALDB
MRPCRQWKYFGLLFRLRGQCFRAFSSSSRFFCSKDEGSITQKNLMSCARDKTDEHTVIEVYDPPFESQWEEDPEFDYTNGQVQPLTYDFISQDEFFSLEELRLLLKHENVRDLLFLRLPSNHVCQYMVIGSGLSQKHVRSSASLVFRVAISCCICSSQKHGHIMIWNLFGLPDLSMMKFLTAFYHSH